MLLIRTFEKTFTRIGSLGLMIKPIVEQADYSLLSRIGLISTAETFVLTVSNFTLIWTTTCLFFEMPLITIMTKIIFSVAKFSR